MVCYGEKAVPGLQAVYFHGFDSDGTDRTADQKAEAGRKGCLHRTLRRKEAGSQPEKCEK